MAAEVEVQVGSRTVRVTNPDRVYFPARGETKLDLVRYYLSVGDGIVRALRDRPCMMHASRPGWPKAWRAGERCTRSGSRTARDHTIASAYSVRGVPEATVSTPVTWDEIDDVDPRAFTIATVPGRFAQLGDLHQGIDDTAYSLNTLLEWADRDGLD